MENVSLSNSTRPTPERTNKLLETLLIVNKVGKSLMDDICENSCHLEEWEKCTTLLNRWASDTTELRGPGCTHRGVERLGSGRRRQQPVLGWPLPLTQIRAILGKAHRSEKWTPSIAAAKLTGYWFFVKFCYSFMHFSQIYTPRLTQSCTRTRIYVHNHAHYDTWKVSYRQYSILSSSNIRCSIVSPPKSFVWSQYSMVECKRNIHCKLVKPEFLSRLLYFGQINYDVSWNYYEKF